MHETAFGWWLGKGVIRRVIKIRGIVVSDVVDRNVWGCGSMALDVGVAWVT